MSSNEQRPNEVRKQREHRWRRVFLTSAAVVIGASLLQKCMDNTRVGFDDTDDWVNRTRSGMVIRIDHGTGCQYLQPFFGGLTPRLDSNGQPMCKSKQ